MTVTALEGEKLCEFAKHDESSRLSAFGCQQNCGAISEEALWDSLATLNTDSSVPAES
jgi:hypothetical protein